MRMAVALLSLALLLAGCADMVRKHIYRPDASAGQAVAWEGAAPAEVTVRTADGLTLTGYYWAPAPGRSDILVYFHGNGGNQRAGALGAAPLAAGGHGVLVASYRGYGGNPGKPSERGLIADGDAWMAKAAELVPGGQRYIFGHSLGGGVAMQMAARHRVAGLATLGTFTRIDDVAPWFARPFLPDHFDNRAAIARVRAPVLLFHGTRDATIPFAHAERLRAASANRARLIPLKDGGHHVDMARLAPLVWQGFAGSTPQP